VPVDRALSRRSQPSAQALFADIVAERPRRVRSRVLVLVVVVVLVAAMLMAFVALHRVGTSLSIAPVCYESDSLQAPNVVVTAGDPKQACASLWAGGRFGRSVPDFDVCVLPSGVLAVFPGESGSVCSRLDLPASSGDNSVERFVDALNRRVSARCFRLDQAAQIAKEELKRRRLAGWRILPGDGTADAVRTCASIGADPSARTIALVPIRNPRPASRRGP